MRTTLPSENEERFFDGLRQAEEFFMGTSAVQKTLTRLVGILEEESIPYAIVGGLALNEYGYLRVTVDIDILLTSDGLEQLKRRCVGRGYLEKFPGSRGLRDTETGVEIDVVITGEYPGDGKPKEVAFPDPAIEFRGGDGVRLLPIERLVELKLASGLSAPHRLRDLADVLELIRHADLPRSMNEDLDPSVREKFIELWEAADQAGEEAQQSSE